MELSWGGWGCKNLEITLCLWVLRFKVLKHDFNYEIRGRNRCARRANSSRWQESRSKKCQHKFRPGTHIFPFCYGVVAKTKRIFCPQRAKRQTWGRGQEIIFLKILNKRTTFVSRFFIPKLIRYKYLVIEKTADLVFHQNKIMESKETVVLPRT